jgi:hypothetical protein
VSLRPIDEQIWIRQYVDRNITQADIDLLEHGFPEHSAAPDPWPLPTAFICGAIIALCILFGGL